MVQGIKICNNTDISDALSSSLFIISDNRIMSETEIWPAKLKEIEQFEDLAVDGSIILNCIINK
jgi:hypothetical protein